MLGRSRRGRRRTLPGFHLRHTTLNLPEQRRIQRTSSFPQARSHRTRSRTRRRANELLRTRFRPRSSAHLQSPNPRRCQPPRTQPPRQRHHIQSPLLRLRHLGRPRPRAPYRPRRHARRWTAGARAKRPRCPTRIRTWLRPLRTRFGQQRPRGTRQRPPPTSRSPPAPNRHPTRQWPHRTERRLGPPLRPPPWPTRLALT